MSVKKQKRDPDERVADMNRIFDKYVMPLLGFTLAVILVFGVIVPVIRSCASKPGTEEPDGRQYSSAEFFIRRSLLFDRIASSTDLFEQAGCLVMNDEDGITVYAWLENSDEILDNVTDPNGNRYSAVMSSDAYGEAGQKKNLTLMIYSGSLFIAIAEEEGGTYSALFDNESFEYPESDSDARELVEKVLSGEWSRMLREYKDWLTPLLRQAEGS